ncbi:2OG-Fe(II) oxygenase [Lysobacter dokdonensis DS-58]|uniref:2OG-Fe(II) oxygenase n=1 Tax=Lysobacter dokdonensis DS-58 TaxID=1300345 RepID=A0A0A2WR21_9GAMM|nr:2OG-Fe(II) oxygenase [Lysobacter dokdonensis]KGQ20735.1 2OG-Fe(II) oxygenase [Lysobacter dokdonensis DS-58]
MIPNAAVHDVAALADALRTHGACRLPDFPDADTTRALRDDLDRLLSEGALAPASVGRGASHGPRADIRGDSTLWLDNPRTGPAAAAFLAALDTLRIELNRRLFLGADEVEAHYAAYPPGTRYARHRDRFKDDDARVLSLVTYLNPDWIDTDGGALRLALDEGEIDIVPRTGSIVFLSECEHEVLPATRERRSIAAWMRRRPR